MQPAIGIETETDEAIPMWLKISQIPYDEMWEDDIHWLPQMLEGQTFKGYFEFDGDKMLSRKVVFD